MRILTHNPASAFALAGEDGARLEIEPLTHDLAPAPDFVMRLYGSYGRGTASVLLDAGEMQTLQTYVEGVLSKQEAQKRLQLQGSCLSTLTLHYQNRGEPYREGVTFGLQIQGCEEIYAFIEEYEAARFIRWNTSPERMAA
ncbi:MAG: hypothetical protein A2580_08945 [Hydrogenophilales bacterium RIFOXYD1_FULL_62_11]|nr:MAG: hypothetical protein A2580_08945 [Hydrogenophilales bacterium RIFOXYD1_FULL_62_11]